MNTTSGIITVC